MQPNLSNVQLRELRAAGKAARQRLSRSAQGDFVPTVRDPIAILEEQHRSRVPELVPIRVSRMLESRFAFYRAASSIMTHDLSQLPHTGALSVICGDAHIGNFGLFATPERHQALELNDFDEAGTGPWEWDVKRFATSVLLAALDAGMHQHRAFRATRSAVRAYRKTLDDLLDLSVLERFYYQADVCWLSRMLDTMTYSVVHDAARKARSRTSNQALKRLAATTTDGSLRIIDEPLLMMHADDVTIDVARALLHDYIASARSDIAFLMTQFELVDVALRVVGVGSVGTRCYVLLFVGPSGEPFVLQVKEAQRTVLETHGGILQFLLDSGGRDEGNEGHRVVTAQRILQSASDPFLGFFRYDGRDYYVRQFRDMKGIVNTGSLSPGRFQKYARLCAALLARAHAQNRSAAFISGYMGGGAGFDRAIARWAMDYERQVSWDFAAFEAAAASGRLPA